MRRVFKTVKQQEIGGKISNFGETEELIEEIKKESKKDSKKSKIKEEAEELDDQEKIEK